MALLSSNKFAAAAHDQTKNYERKFRKYVPFAEIVDALRRQAAFDIPLKFVLDRDTESGGFFKSNPQWDFGNAGVRFQKKDADGSQPTLVVTWSPDYEQKVLQDILDELGGLGLNEEDSVSIELVSPSAERMLSRYGNTISVEKGGAVIHFQGAWQKPSGK